VDQLKKIVIIRIIILPGLNEKSAQKWDDADANK
jgi:hypothetical protein